MTPADKSRLLALVAFPMLLLHGTPADGPRFARHVHAVLHDRAEAWRTALDLPLSK